MLFRIYGDFVCAFLRTKIPLPGILLSTYQWKEGYLVILSYIYFIYACLVYHNILSFSAIYHADLDYVSFCPILGIC